MSPVSWKWIPGRDLQSKFDRQNNKTFGRYRKHFEENIQRISLWTLGDKGTQKAQIKTKFDELDCWH